MIDTESEPAAIVTVHTWTPTRPTRPPASAPGRAVPFPDRPDPLGRARVGLVSPVCFSAGAEEWMRLLAGSLDPARFVVRGLAILHGEGPTDPAMVDRFRAMMAVGFGEDAGLDLARTVDLVVGWDMGGFPAKVAALPDPPRVVGVSHSPPESAWGVRSMANLDGVGHLVAVSELAVGTLPADRRAECRVVWNGVDEARLVARRSREEMHAAWGVPPGALVAGYYGRLSEEKRGEVMLGVARGLPGPWHVVVVGEGGMREGLESEARAEGLDNLHFAGRDPAAGDVLGGFDALVGPSEYESFGLSMAEGLTQGVPLVATPAGVAAMVPGLARMVGPMADGGEIASAILADRADPIGTSARVERARAFAAERLSSARFSRDWSDYLAEVVPIRPRRTLDPAARDRVLACPERGREGGLVLAEDERACCGGGEERTACRAGKGARPGRATLRECLACKA